MVKNGYLTSPASKLSRLLFLSASKCKNIKNIPCPTFADIHLAIRAMMTVNVMGNKIGKEQLFKLQEIMKAHPTLVSLCGIAHDATEANLSGLGMDAEDAVILADELPTKGALMNLNISSNHLAVDISSWADERNWISDMTGIKALAAALPECK